MTESDHIQKYLLGQHEDAFLRYHLFNELYQPGTIQRFAELQIPPDNSILEIGCGIGDTACYMAKNIVPEGHVTAFDEAADLIEYANRQADELGIKNITFIHSTAQEFRFESNRWDVAHTRYVLSYLSDADEILYRTFGALRSSGIFFGEEIAQVYIKHGQTKWYDNMLAWFTALIEAGGGNANYGTSQLASDLLAAGFNILGASAYWPIENQSKIAKMLLLVLSREMKQSIIELQLATEEEVGSVISELNAPERNYVISPSMAAQVIARKS